MSQWLLLHRRLHGWLLRLSRQMRTQQSTKVGLLFPRRPSYRGQIHIAGACELFSNCDICHELVDWYFPVFSLCERLHIWYNLTHHSRRPSFLHSVMHTWTCSTRRGWVRCVLHRMRGSSIDGAKTHIHILLNIYDALQSTRFCKRCCLSTFQCRYRFS